MFVAIMKVENNRVAKFMEFEDRQSAEAHVNQRIDRFPDAFVTETSAPILSLLVEDGVATVSPPASLVEEQEKKRAAIRAAQEYALLQLKDDPDAPAEVKEYYSK